MKNTIEMKKEIVRELLGLRKNAKVSRYVYLTEMNNTRTEYFETSNQKLKWTTELERVLRLRELGI